MASFSSKDSLADFQKFNYQVYGPIDDRFYTAAELATQHQRFAMRAIKGIRKGEPVRLKNNLLVSLSFLMAVANRFHIDTEEETWRRFPALCSYCGSRPCVCKSQKPTKRRTLKRDSKLRPKDLANLQKMFESIYPSSTRSAEHAGIHFAEEVGEVGEAIFSFLTSHAEKQFQAMKVEIADCISCLFGIANSAGIDVAKELGTMFKNNCHVCHNLPCTCSFKKVARY